MSSLWRYVTTEQSSQISEIWCDGPVGNPIYAGIRIFPWRVRMTTGEVRGLYSLSLEDFTGNDRSALQQALKNARELQKKWSGESQQTPEVEFKSCWSCC